MGEKQRSVGLLILLCFFCKDGLTESNNCSFSLNKQLLTCKNVNLKGLYIENQMSNSTKLLRLIDTANLKLGPAFHTEPFEILETYHIENIRSLEIAPYCFQKLTNLRHIKITDNKYTVVRSNTFFGATGLEVLNLNNNGIQIIEVGAFDKLRELKMLEITHNNFASIHSNQFQHLKNLDSLFLYHSNIENLEPDCFNGLNSLRVLDLTYNSISKIETKMFNGLTQLSHLYLSFNKVETIDGDFDCGKLEFLYLQNNNLRAISSTIFRRLWNLLDLDLSRNKISSIDEDAFLGLPKLTNLNYKDNNLTQHMNLNFNVSKPFITS